VGFDSGVSQAVRKRVEGRYRDEARERNVNIRQREEKPNLHEKVLGRALKRGRRSSKGCRRTERRQTGKKKVKLVIKRQIVKNEREGYVRNGQQASFIHVQSREKLRTISRGDQRVLHLQHVVRHQRDVNVRRKS